MANPIDREESAQELAEVRVMSSHRAMCGCEACMDRRLADAGEEVIVRDEIDCARCGIEFGDGRGFCRRAKGTDICLECALEVDPPSEPRERDIAPVEESPSYRDAMRDSGRWK